MDKKHKIGITLSTLGMVMILFGVTFSFFNYTRTGVSNTIKVGRIYFESEQTNTITLLDVFPIDASDANTSSHVGTGTINITGDTTYDDGVEYQLTISNLTNTVGSKEIPIDVVVTATGIGDSEDDYFNARGEDTSIYKVLSTGTISNNKQLLVGYIPKGSTGVDGTVTIKAYLDKEKIAISDTYPEETVRKVVENYSVSACETALAGNTNASTICASANSIENAMGSLTSEQITSLVTAGVLKEYTNETPASFGEGRTVLTTQEWNELQANGISFQVRVEANEGVWVTEPIMPICKRVTNVSNLHTETCTNSFASQYCQGDGYALNETISYGNAKALGSTLTAGDAFDCDVNGNGIIDTDANNKSTERFYYVSPYYNTDTLTFDNETGYATLIYYSNTVSGVASTNGSAYYTSAKENWHGPVTAKRNLPTTSQWSNIELKATSRRILACSDVNCSNTPVETTNNGINQIENPFSYSGYAGRLLTLKELSESGCAALSEKTSLRTSGSLKACNFLLERTTYADSNKAIYGSWFETPIASDSKYVWNSGVTNGMVSSYSANSPVYGVRPVIDVPMSRLEY